MISGILDSFFFFFIVLKGRRGTDNTDNQATNCSAYQKMVFHCSGSKGKAMLAGVCGLAVTESQRRDQGSERNEVGRASRILSI